MKDKVILITGSSQGMGAAAARIATERGARVIIHGRTDSDHLKSVASDTNAFKIVCDISDKSQVEREMERVKAEFGTVDMLINSAGHVKGKPFMELTEDDWMSDYKVNMLGAAHVCQAAYPLMKEHGGSIVLVSSLRGLTNHSRDGIMPYSTSKAGVCSMTTALAKAWSPKIRVNCMAPGGTNTEMAKTWTPELRKMYQEGSLLDVIPEPEDMAKIMLYLAGDESAVLTGQIITADAGYSLPPR